MLTGIEAFALCEEQWKGGKGDGADGNRRTPNRLKKGGPVNSQHHAGSQRYGIVLPAFQPQIMLFR